MDKRILEIKRNLENKTTEELRHIYQEKNTDQWSKAAFLAIESILNDRFALQGVEPDDTQTPKSRLSPSARKSFTRKLKEGYKWETQQHFYSDLQSSFIGKRNLWVWLYGLVYPIVWIALSAIEISELKANPEQSIRKYILSDFYLYAIIVNSIIVIVCLSFFFRQTWSRKAYYFLPFVQLFVFYLIMHGKIDQDAFIQTIGRTTGGLIIPFIIYYVITNSFRNKLFFGLQVLDWEIEEYWIKRSNKRANLSAYLAISSPILILVVAHTKGVLSSRDTRIAIAVLIISTMLFIIWLANKARKEENLDAVPPIGGKEYAISAIVVASLWIIAMLFLVGSTLHS